jgi:hypothetical protein
MGAHSKRGMQHMTARIEEEQETISRATPLGLVGNSMIQKRGQQLAMSVDKKKP